MSLVRQLIPVFLLFCMTVHADAVAESCHATSQKDIAALFERWNQSLQSGDPAKVVANYAPGSVLLPTLSNRPRVSVKEKADYFEHFMTGKPVGSIDRRVIHLDCNNAIDTGLYTFRFADGSIVKARYTFTYQWSDDRWLITSHHSSMMPERN